MAGKTLRFGVEITDIRDATEEELEHGHVHGRAGTSTENFEGSSRRSRIQRLCKILNTLIPAFAGMTSKT